MEKRFYVESEDICEDILTIKDEEHTHLSKVLRLQVGDKVECFYNNSDVLNCEILSITKNSSTLKILSKTPCNANPKVNITLFQGLPKLDKLELITQKITEIGLTKIVPFSSAFCIAKENLNKIDRLKKIIVSACKQCGRTRLLEVENPIKFNQLAQYLKNFELIIFANETEDKTPLKQVINNFNGKDLKNIAIIVGSEGGFSKTEIEEITALKNVYSISLGKRILRTETASIVLSGLINYELGEK